MSAPPTPSPIARFRRCLRDRGWNDAGRDCWCKTPLTTDPSLVLRWTDTLNPEHCARLTAELDDLRAALGAAMQSGGTL